MDDLFTVPLQNMAGETQTLASYRGQVLLIVNVASRCGFTRQYKELELLHRSHETKGLAVLGFPCDQFMHQEPGDNHQIKAFAESCFRVTFPLFAKIDVRGTKQSPLYAYLQQHIQKKPFIFIPWNFTKILVDREGRVLQRFWPFTSMKKVTRAIDKLL